MNYVTILKLLENTKSVDKGEGELLSVDDKTQFESNAKYRYTKS